MGNRRRKDKNFKIGESSPGTVGDSKGNSGESTSPMVNIHNRRRGKLLSKKETAEFLNSDKNSTHNQDDPNKGYLDAETHEPKYESKQEEYADKFGHLVSEEMKAKLRQKRMDKTMSEAQELLEESEELLE